MTRRTSAFLLVLAIAMPLRARALPGQGTMYGTNGIAVALENLPEGPLRSRLESLPPPARERALKWMNRISFPAEDVEFLCVDAGGGIFYSDPLPEGISQSELEADPALEGISPANAFQLHSKPGSPHVVYINTLGYEITDTSWSSGTLYALPFDLDGDTNSFSDVEKVAIIEIWHRVAEDYAPFNIDVTTEPPANFGPDTGHILITKSVDATGTPMPSSSAGGVAYVDVWGTSYYKSYQPALVYYNNLAGSSDFIAEACSHELGHNLGLSHDGSSTVSYYNGHGPRSVKWAPIMGTGYRSDLSQWSRGEYPDANNTQDDIAIITSHLNLRQDDHADSTTGATALLVDGSGHVASSNPEFDPGNQRPENKGIINDSTDIDLFYFDVAEGPVELTVEPAWAAFFRTYREGVNLDIRIRLLDDSGNEWATDDDLLNTGAEISTNVAAGRYYLEISGTGNTTPIEAYPEYSLYSDYGTMGQFYIYGSIPVGEPDLTAPTPNPMTWAVPPAATGRNSISMTASPAIDDSGVVQYQFVCTNKLTFTSAWQTENSYVAAGLQADTTYCFQVRARDGSGNETTLSTTAVATTWPNTDPVCQDDTASVNEDSSRLITVLDNDNDADGDTLAIYSLTPPVHGDASISGNEILYTPDSNFVGVDQFQYSITDGFGGFSTGTVQVDVLNVNDPPIAADDPAEVLRGGAVWLNVLGNDTDAEGDPLSIVSATSAAKGTVTIHADNTLTYTTSGNGLGSDSFAYTVTDGSATATANVTIKIVRELSSSAEETGEILSSRISGGMLTLEWVSVSGTSYTVLQCTNLTGGAWFPVVTNIAGTATSTTNAIAIGTEDTAFYRIEVQQ